MSDATDVVAPEASPAVPVLEPDAPEDGTAVDTESATQQKRFNGLMAAHQKALEALASERDARLAAEARYQEGTNEVTDDATLTEVQALRQELAESRLAAAKAEALADYPDAAPFADLIEGRNPGEVREVTRAFAERAALIKAPAPVVEPTVEVPSTEETAPIPVPARVVPVVVAPVVTGGELAPGHPTTAADALAEAHRIALQEKPDSQEAWDNFFISRLTPESASGLA